MRKVWLIQAAGFRLRANQRPARPENPNSERATRQFDVEHASTVNDRERESIEQLQAVIGLVANKKAGVARATVVGVVWTWHVAMVVQSNARGRGLTVWLVSEQASGSATVAIAPLKQSAEELSETDKPFRNVQLGRGNERDKS